MAAAERMVRISDPTHEKIKEIQKREHLKQSEVIDRAVGLLEHELFLKELNADFAALSDADHNALQSEYRQWDAATSDGLGG